MSLFLFIFPFFFSWIWKVEYYYIDVYTLTRRKRTRRGNRCMREGPGACVVSWVVGMASRRLGELVGMFWIFFSLPLALSHSFSLLSSSRNPSTHSARQTQGAPLRHTLFFLLFLFLHYYRHVLRQRSPRLAEPLLQRTRNKYPSFLIQPSSLFFPPLFSLASFHLWCPSFLSHPFTFSYKTSRSPFIPLCFMVVLALEPVFFFPFVSRFCTV
ncbi:hypothetical protein MAPG_09978 [Magnaporthiopsis poae ATCC 64411]|uniref:Uncharacterized protein n=1 Tax=Magnaporthiopsis poae (strain ATCC 64411 / 73-15) TaxID=644358 RepID=A0A0C4EBD0_MAGP6|nr:hypothetical protein MAPG_09978 [Magnaporthiopsis poae ATCC 64411]